MSTTPEGITNPSIDDLLETTDSKYRLVLFAAKRARQINAYYSQLGEGLLENVGPLVSASPEEKPLSIALREIKEGMLQYSEVDPDAEAEESGFAADPSFSFVDPLADDADPLA
ncbi:DNA-directed RNA polymerase subunit omega [Tessaracoccus caeni]|uniref:DNA-directed RNA polymerase subunit omega n=1 Tax=Tessaracoccus caeni TaxID=3031239 RepID=UPI0023DBC2B1|nr:DNA-directed RNA polymerase subunit omega [Tessaracoccus caeni]MDF1489963.1 DNA-directed RNA polymerase subunit omega [Tessaracoccus caeni]